MTSKRSSDWICVYLSSLSVALLAFLLTLPSVAAPAADDADPEPPGDFPKTTSAHRAASSNNLKQIVLAMINSADANAGNMPANAIVDKAGKPLLSWRVAILPYIEQQGLYTEFKLDEPWDSKHNKALLSKMPKTYAPTISGKPAVANTTYYQVFTGSSTPFNPKEIRGSGALSFSTRYPVSFTDGTSNTILITEAEKPVPWTKPDDVVYDAKKALPKVGGLFREGFHVAMADGSVKFIGRKFDGDSLRAAITPNGGEVIDWAKLPAAKK